MVSIIDCARNVMGDKFAFIKMLILSIPLMLSVWAYLSGNAFLSVTSYIVFGVIFAAVFFETIKRSLNNELMLMPPFLMPIPMFWTLLMVIVASIVPVAINFGIYVGWVALFASYPDIFTNIVVLYMVNAVVGLLCSSIYFATITQYLDTGKLKDSFNLIVIAKSIKTFFVNIILYGIQALIFTLIALIPLAIIVMLYGPTSGLIVIYSSILVMTNYLIFADYIAQTKKDADCNL